MANTEYSRFLLKRSLNSGVVPTVPLINEISTFTATDIFEGELFYNVADGILFSRDLAGITVVGTPAAPANLLNTLLLGNNTGATDIVIDSPQVIRNPLASAPLDSYITTGTAVDPNVIVLSSQNLAVGNAAELLLTSNLSTAVTVKADNPTIFSSAVLTVDSILGNTTFFIKTDTINTLEIVHQITGVGGGHKVDFSTPTTTAVTVVGDSDIHSDFTGVAGNSNWTQDDISISSSLAGGAYEMLLTSTAGGSLNIKVPNVNLISAAGPIAYQAFDNDAAAGVGGLVMGDLYQTTGAGAAPLNAAGILMIKQ